MLLSGDKKVNHGGEEGRGGGYNNNFSRQPQRGGQRMGGMRRDNRGRDDRRRSGGFSNFKGPHFPTSRLLDETRKKLDR
jgi:hypothetical protein